MPSFISLGRRGAHDFQPWYTSAWDQPSSRWFSHFFLSHDAISILSFLMNWHQFVTASHSPIHSRHGSAISRKHCRRPGPWRRNAKLNDAEMKKVPAAAVSDHDPQRSRLTDEGQIGKQTEKGYIDGGWWWYFQKWLVSFGKLRWWGGRRKFSIDIPMSWQWGGQLSRYLVGFYGLWNLSICRLFTS